LKIIVDYTRWFIIHHIFFILLLFVGLGLCLLSSLQSLLLLVLKALFQIIFCIVKLGLLTLELRLGLSIQIGQLLIQVWEVLLFEGLLDALKYPGLLFSEVQTTMEI
jgi:hypothetical protein